VISRGAVVKDETGYVGRSGHGRFVKRELSQNLI
jgi:dihydropyrimidinase